MAAIGNVPDNTGYEILPDTGYRIIPDIRYISVYLVVLSGISMIMTLKTYDFNFQLMPPDLRISDLGRNGIRLSAIEPCLIEFLVYLV